MAHQQKAGMVGKVFVLLDTCGDRKQKEKKRKTAMRKRQSVEGVGGVETCAAVILSFNPFESFLPPVPTFSVLIDKHWEGMGARD